MKRWGTELRLGLSLTSSSTTSQSRPRSYDQHDPAAAAVSADWSSPNINYNNINRPAPPMQQQIRINGQEAESSSSSSSTSADHDAAAGIGSTDHHHHHFFVKVYMEGIPIGRKLDLFAHHGYHELVTTLTRMFRTTILYPGIDRVHYDQEDHVLTYEDKEGDLMMVGDVPWDLFLSTVKKLQITRSDNC